jgi:hypothetical protein
MAEETTNRILIGATISGEPPCLPKSPPGVSATLTTTAFARSSLRWLEIGS